MSAEMTWRPPTAVGFTDSGTNYLCSFGLGNKKRELQNGNAKFIVVLNFCSISDSISFAVA
jgi:hypothetical protein